MGNFLVIVPSRNSGVAASRLFNFGISVARSVKFQLPNSTVENDWALAAMFPRRNRTGSPIVIHPEIGDWLLAIGTWFHNDGYGSGDEFRLLKRYLAVGADQIATELEGFFVIVVGDTRKQETVVFTDLIGSCHCFMRVCKYGIALSSSSIILAGLSDFGLDPIGCQEFLYTGIIYEDRTIYKEVQKLGPAGIFRFSKGALKAKERYWEISDLAPESLDGKQAAKTLWGALINGAEKIAKVFSNPVCDLTGGYDSRVIAACLSAAGVEFSTTVSYASETPDVAVSRRLANFIGTKHLCLSSPKQISLDQAKRAFSLTDGEYDLVEYARILEIHQTLSERFDVSLNGSFGEVARGYWWELLFPHVGRRRQMDGWKVARLRFAAQPFDSVLFPPEIRLDLVSHFKGVIERTNKSLCGVPNTLLMDHIYLMMRMQRWQGKIASSTNQLWPCFSPFYFRSVLETMLQVKARLRQRSLLIRQMLLQYQPRFAEFPLEHGYPALPVTWKTFPRFWPLPAYYGRKAISKLAQKVSIKGMWQGSEAGDVPARIHLWQEEEVMELLNQSTMKLCELLNKTALKGFLSQSQQPAFLFNDQWARMLSLEYALHFLERVKNKFQMS